MMARRSRKTDFVTGLDIGSSAIRIAVGKPVIMDDGKTKLQIVGSAEVLSEGVHRGMISSIEEVISSISKCLEKVERLIGLPIEHIWVGVSGSNIITQENRGIVSVTRSDGEVSHDDVVRVIENARMISEPPNYEMIHIIPKSYIVDGQSNIKDPIGMTGLRLEVDAQIIYCLSAHLKNIKKSVIRTGVDIDDIVLSILATGDMVATSRQKDLGLVVVNIGSSTTTLVVYEHGDVQHTAILPIGSEHVTNDIAIGLKTSIDIAERVKIEYGSCSSKNNIKKQINLSEFGGEDEVFSLHYLSEIVEARMSEIMERIDDELASINKSRLLPAGVIFTGGGAKIGGIVELSKRELGLPTTLGYPIDVASSSNYATDLAFTTAIGLANWSLYANDVKAKTSKKNSVGNVFRGIKTVGKWFMP